MPDDTPTIYLPPGVRTGDRASPMDALSRSVVHDARGELPLVGAQGYGLMWLGGGMVDGFTEWGTSPKQRDRELRAFATKETYFASALGIVAARNAAMSWRTTGDERTARAAAEMLNNANFGGGWEEFITRVTLDLALADSGAFVELVRAGDAPTSPVIGINNLDSLRCWPTGDPETPVIYEDVRGAHHELKWYQVVQLLEMAAPTTFATGGIGYKIGYSNATRVLRAAQILRNIEVLKDERTGGRFMRALHVVSGVDPEMIRARMAQASEEADNAGLMRFIMPAVVASVNPNATIDHKEIALATMPDGWDEEKALQAYILALSMGFATDYQEFAPLPSGNIGTGQQSQVLHQKARGKGPGLFRQLILRLMNLHGVMPANAEFEWDEQDLEAEQQEAEIRKARAEERGLRIQSGELTPEEARQLALDAGDLPQELYDAAGMVDVTPDVAVEGEEPNRRGERGLRSVAAAVWPDPYGLDDGGLSGERAARAVPFGQLLSSRLHRMYAATSDDAHGLGYFRSTDERKKVGAAIGPALSALERELKRQGVWDVEIGPEDADRLVDAGIRELSGERALRDSDPRRAGPDDERLEFEDDVAADVLRGLGAVRRRLAARLRDGD